MGLTLMIVPVWIIFASSTHTSLFINTNGLQFFLGDSFKENFEKHPATSIAEASDAIEKITGIKRSSSQVREFLIRTGLPC